MRTVSALLLILCVGFFSPGAMAQEKVAGDRYGDPLPEGAIARFGT